uniref:Lipocalin/cytosolic fatty-acid binding domain-containing protein n=1 Tax=Amblyomma maculatum TaxID=34609 RepID=G3MQI4_AMBMU
MVRYAGTETYHTHQMYQCCSVHFEDAERIMKAVTVTSHLLAALAIAAAILYEDNPRNSNRQHATLMTSVAEPLFVKWQTINRALVPSTRCQAIMKMREARAGLFQYSVYYTDPVSRTLEVFTSTLATSTTVSHILPNAVTYQTLPDGPVRLYKVMYADTQQGCFILVTKSPSYGRACRLLQTAKTVDREVPRDCMRVYRNNCPGDTMNIYTRNCRLMIQHMISRSK